jgi:putative transcriptional regulator
MKKIVITVDEMLKKRERTAYWLALQLGMTHGGFYKILHGKNKALNLELLARMCELLECEPSALLALVEEKKDGKKKVTSKAK